MDLNNRGDVTFGRCSTPTLTVMVSRTPGFTNGERHDITDRTSGPPFRRRDDWSDGPPEQGNWGSGAMSDEKGQVFCQATLTDGTGVLMVATPNGKAPGVPLSARSSLQSTVQANPQAIAVLDQAILDLGNMQPASKRKH